MNKVSISLIAAFFVQATSIMAQSNILKSLIPETKAKPEKKKEVKKEKPIDFSKIKALPLTESVLEQVNKCDAEIKKASYLPRKDEFESVKELRKRRQKEKEKLLKSFAQKPIFINTYELECKSSRPPRLFYESNPPSIDVVNVNEAIDLACDQIGISSSLISTFNAKEIDFAGIIKTNKDESNGWYKFSVAEARQVKRNLGGSWKCKVKVWLRFNLKYQCWKSVKVFIMPANK